MSGPACWAVLGLAWIGALTLIWAFMSGADEDRGACCRCGHARSLHEHMHERTYCALCIDCFTFRPVPADVHRARTTPLPYQAGQHGTDLGEQLFDQDADDWTQWADELSTS